MYRMNLGTNSVPGFLNSLFCSLVAREEPFGWPSRWEIDHVLAIYLLDVYGSQRGDSCGALLESYRVQSSPCPYNSIRYASESMRNPQTLFVSCFSLGFFKLPVLRSYEVLKASIQYSI